MALAPASLPDLSQHRNAVLLSAICGDDVSLSHEVNGLEERSLMRDKTFRLRLLDAALKAHRNAHSCVCIVLHALYRAGDTWQTVGDDPLLKVLSKDWATTLGAMLRWGYPANYTLEGGRSLLAAAVGYRAHRCTQLLVDCGADPHDRAGMSYSPDEFVRIHRLSIAQSIFARATAGKPTTAKRAQKRRSEAERLRDNGVLRNGPVAGKRRVRKPRRFRDDADVHT